MLNDIPSTIRKGHINVMLHDPFPELHTGGNHPNSPTDLVAWLHLVWKHGSVRNAVRYTKIFIGWGEGYCKVYRLEKQLGEKVFIRNARPFTLTSGGENLIRRYTNGRSY